MTLRMAHITTGFMSGLVASFVTVSFAQAQDIPDWQPHVICSSDSAKGQCLLFEQRAQNNVIASWSVLPQSVRAFCLARFKPPLEPSWRILGDCIEIEGREARRVQEAAQKKREEDALAQLRNRAGHQSRSERKQRSTTQKTDEQKRIADEEASFMARLAEQRRTEKLAASAKSAAKVARATEVERKRIEAEEASFTALLAAQRKEDAARRRKAADRRSQAAADKVAATKRAETERRRIAEEEASFMTQLAAQGRADADAAKRKAAAKKQARQKAAQTCQARLKQVKSSGTIRFALDNAKIAGSKSTALLDELAKVAAQCEGQLSIRVEGHTDSRGSTAVNSRLSEARAQSVVDYLMTKGVAKERISARGFGSSKPIASNRTRAGRAKNRRIEFKVE